MTNITQNNPKVNYLLFTFFLIYVFFLVLYVLVMIDYASDPLELGIIAVSAVSASIFILLVRLDTEASSFRNIIIGYLFAMLIGIFFHWLIFFMRPIDIFGNHFILKEAVTALSVLVTILLFLIFHIDHPPAVGVTFGLVIENWTLISLGVFATAILWLVLLRVLLVRYPQSFHLFQRKI